MVVSWWQIGGQLVVMVGWRSVVSYLVVSWWSVDARPVVGSCSAGGQLISVGGWLLVGLWSVGGRFVVCWWSVGRLVVGW